MAACQEELEEANKNDNHESIKDYTVGLKIVDINMSIKIGVVVLKREILQHIIKRKFMEILIQSDSETKYQLERIIFAGTFGMVVESYDYNTQSNVALKIQHKEAYEYMYQNEVSILRKLGTGSENVVKMYDFFKIENLCCISFELLGLDLHKVLRIHRGRLPINKVKNVIKCVLRGLSYTSSLDIVHCDIKPLNIAITNVATWDAKIFDFGSSCIVGSIPSYCDTRSYRSPEMAMRLHYFDTKADIWAVGCIVVEMFTRKVLFQSKNNLDHIVRIVERLGWPPLNMVFQTPFQKYIFRENGEFVYLTNEDGTPLNNLTRKKPGQLPVPSFTDHKLNNFIFRTIQWHSKLRMTANEALNHTWLADS